MEKINSEDLFNAIANGDDDYFLKHIPEDKISNEDEAMDYIVKALKNEDDIKERLKEEIYSKNADRVMVVGIIISKIGLFSPKEIEEILDDEKLLQAETSDLDIRELIEDTKNIEKYLKPELCKKFGLNIRKLEIKPRHWIMCLFIASKIRNFMK